MKILNQFIQALTPQVGWEAAFLHGQQEIVANTQIAENTWLLWQVADALAGALRHGESTNGHTVEHHITLIRLKHARHEVEGGGFARAVGAQQTNNLTRLKLKRDALDHRPAAQAQVNTLKLQTHGAASRGAVR